MNLSKSVWAQAHLDASSKQNGEPRTVPYMLLRCQRLKGVISRIFVLRRLFFQIISALPKCMGDPTSSSNRRNIDYHVPDHADPLNDDYLPVPMGLRSRLPQFACSEESPNLLDGS